MIKKFGSIAALSISLNLFCISVDDYELFEKICSETFDKKIRKDLNTKIQYSYSPLWKRLFPMPEELTLSRQANLALEALITVCRSDYNAQVDIAYTLAHGSADPLRGEVSTERVVLDCKNIREAVDSVCDTKNNAKFKTLYKDLISAEIRAKSNKKSWF